MSKVTSLKEFGIVETMPGVYSRVVPQEEMVLDRKQVEALVKAAENRYGIGIAKFTAEIYERYLPKK